MSRGALIAIVVLTCCSCRNPITSSRRTLDSAPTESSSGESILFGKWQVVSASHQTTGKEVYAFRGDTLVIERQHGANNTTSVPTQTSRTNWKFRIDDTKTPRRLILRNEDAARRVAETYAFGFRNGELWMCRDFGDQPITQGSLWPGSGGLVTGLHRVE